MTAQSDYQQALKDIAALATQEATRVTGRPAPQAIDHIKAGSWAERLPICRATAHQPPSPHCATLSRITR